MSWRPLVCAMLAACGRVGFDTTAGDAGGDAANPDSTPPGVVAYVKPFAARATGSLSTDTFTAQAHAAGDVIVFQLACNGSANPPTLSIDAPGWTFLQLDALAGDSATKLWSASFGAFAPDTAVATVAVTSTQMCSVGMAELGDEFSNADPGGGSATFDNHMQVSGTGDCVGSITTAHDHDAVWVACTSNNFLISDSPGYTRGADDATGDWTNYRITTDPAGTDEPIHIASTNTGYVMSMVTLKPQ